MKFSKLTFFVALLCITSFGCSQFSYSPAGEQDNKKTKQDKNKMSDKLETATFGAGCYWCVEAVFEQLEGVDSVVSGFMGGYVDNPSYEAVCAGRTGHAEVCQIKYDPEKISFKELLEVFWKTHDPTTLNRQGGDVGTQYRSAIFFHSDKQKELAEEYKSKLDKSGAFRNPIVTEITKASDFYVAKQSHQEYYRNNKNAGYCRAVIKPKLDKFKKVFGDKIKK
jgi:peptide-methionine (S)-S-oxide reductase